MRHFGDGEKNIVGFVVIVRRRREHVLAESVPSWKVVMRQIDSQIVMRLTTLAFEDRIAS